MRIMDLSDHRIRLTVETVSSDAHTHASDNPEVLAMARRILTEAFANVASVMYAQDLNQPKQQPPAELD